MQLANLTPRVKTQISKTLQLELIEKDVTQKKRARVAAVMPANTVIKKNDDEVIEIVLKDSRNKAEKLHQFQTTRNFYTKSVVRPQRESPKTYALIKTLIDGGSCINLIPKQVVTQIDLTQILNQSLHMRMANGQIQKLNSYMQFVVTVADIPQLIEAYVVKDDTAYSLLLERRWMQKSYPLNWLQAVGVPPEQQIPEMNTNSEEEGKSTSMNISHQVQSRDLTQKEHIRVRLKELEEKMLDCVERRQQFVVETDTTEEELEFGSGRVGFPMERWSCQYQQNLITDVSKLADMNEKRQSTQLLMLT
ncbi:MAG: hypothetical protein M1827_006125 [Pycnora praestabilis]|nr:MAG: hypothetical protein M1827_006125 [Pycnora praestabilis]